MLKDAQLLLLGRDARQLEDPKISNKDKLSIASGVLDMFESAIVQPSDHAYVLDLTRKGELELSDFLAFLTAFEDKEAEAPKPVVRRGRPRKSVAK
jgi:hypothetical protein